MVMENLYVANQSILESCPSSIIRMDANGAIAYISPELCKLAGLEPEQINGQTPAESGPVITKLVQTPGNVDISTEESTRYQFNHTVLDDHATTGEIHIFTNITTLLDLYSDNQRLKEEARQLQLVDQDTSLLTKRALLLVLEAQVSRCRRYETPLSVMMMELNNDSDNADVKLQLLKLSRLLKDQLRWSDMIARTADKQFTIILPETESSDAAALVTKLGDTISNWGDEYAVNFTLSAWKKGINTTDLLMRCEHELHSTKHTGNSGQDVA